MRFHLPKGRACIMGVLNVTPDSFSDGGRYLSLENAIVRADEMVAEGADIIDVGGESTRPGAEAVSEDEEIRRVIPVVQFLAARGIPVSLDTSKASVAKRGIEAGAAVINDVTGFTDGEMLTVCAESDVTICIMHMQGTPRTMQDNPTYESVIEEVRDYLLARASNAEAKGIARERIWIDPGIGFGKTVEHNIELLRGIPSLVASGYPVLIGASRKSFLGKIVEEPEAEKRAGASVAAALFAICKGASIVRVHDVGATSQAAAAWRVFA